ncbi:hypothetical protein GGS23DRAFT_576522 [Durotheca rogersii]|uniref:uncharacterized protein n=1 Tax=Durotheca rogersii TaxID=419775 RepID=UPI00221F3652|nr:uncharacterized protein GGS23DRAFT_576522 [Durotheca rogersii]KAI5861373.1 hypothetical protein GGS23DRAFT_576522 [Durotheca rogersii]
MATPGSTQALLGAFFFGILFNAASAAMVLYIIGHGSAIFRDGLRLVLILFLASSAAWALVEFLATIIEPTAASTCQVAAVFSSLFDQLARFSVEQYLVWAVRTENKSIAGLVPQVLVLGRFGVGMAFAGVTGSDFNPTCVPISNVPPVSITVIVIDALIIGLVAIQLFVTGVANKKKSVTLVILGLAIWTGMSVVLLLGMKTTELVLKTTLPAVGLAILVALVTVLSGTLVDPRGPPPRRPDSPTSRDIGTGRDISSSDSTDYPPSRYEDVKGMNVRAIPAYTSRGDGGVATSVTGAGGFLQRNALKGNPWAKATSGKLVISNPVLIATEGMENALGRIPTVDLVTAASNEKERRTKQAQGESVLIAQRTAPKPPVIDGESNMRRKEVAPSSSAELVRTVSNKTTGTLGGLSVEVHASSTSSELSPGIDKIRRRSPGQPMVPPIPSVFRPVRPGEPIRIPIPRPQEPPELPKFPEPPITPLQRRATTGLPSNPRAQGMKAIAKEARSQRQETVMFVNDIVYDDPSAVKNIVQGASKTPTGDLDSDDSVVNRPRPIPRKGDTDRQVFPVEQSPTGHRRSKSGSSLTSGKSILRAVPGDPIQLPPLPPAPTKISDDAPRPLPNDTKSMTFDEKMDILYITPLSAPLAAPAMTEQQSEVPEVPPMPTEYVMDVRLPATEDIHSPETDGGSISKTTDRSSVRTASILGIEAVPQQHIQKNSASRNATNKLEQSWLTGPSAENERQQRPSRDKTNRGSSPVLPVVSHFSISTMKSDRKTRDEDLNTAWGSVHSPVAAVDVQLARLNARSTYIGKNSQGDEKEAVQNIPSTVVDESVIAKPDTPKEHPESNQESLSNDEDTSAPPVPSAIEQAKLGHFHHRIGDECPTFSTRAVNGRLRKAPPPAPLILRGNGARRAIIVRPAEPSPLESPEAAYQMIQAQLQRFEQPSRDSVESSSQRLALLDNLEREMGQLENKWQSSQNRLDRDSMSSIHTSPRKSRPGSLLSRLAREPSQHTIAERRASRRATLSKSGTTLPKEEGVSMASQASGSSSESLHASAWQARLSEAQMEYVKSTPDLTAKRNNLNFLSVSKASLGSPSPPDTNESELENEANDRGSHPSSPKIDEPVLPICKLWKPQSPLRGTADSGLWVSTAKKQPVSGDVEALPSLFARPAIRKTLASLEIQSSRLWQKPAEANNSGSTNGLWKKFVPPTEVRTRPVTIRPPRKNKRLTQLPDILENPEPLPNKRGTLGLFQFPWGEKSEHAIIHPPTTSMYMAMPGTMTTGGITFPPSLEANSKDAGADEFTTSFFDDYEAEEEDDNLAYLDSEDEGDDFDENTLWEIASLLKADGSSPNNNLFPFPPKTPESANAFGSSDYIAEVLAEQYDDDDNDDDNLVKEEPIPVDRVSLLPKQVDSTPSLLWAQRQASKTRSLGLPQPDSAIWKGYALESFIVVRSHSRPEEIGLIQSDGLWAPKTQGANVTAAAKLLWNASTSLQKDITLASVGASLWEKPALVCAPSTRGGLFDLSTPRIDYRRTTNEPAAISMTRSPRITREPLPTLATNSLWTDETTKNALSISVHLAEVSAPILSTLLWEPTPVASSSDYEGLFDATTIRTDYRRTSKLPAAIVIARKPRKLNEYLASLTSTRLWELQLVSTHSSPSEVATLWSQPAVPVSITPKLFQLDPERKVYRTTSAEPAAIQIDRKPRLISEPLPSLESTELWMGGQTTPTQITWITVSSMQPRYPSVAPVAIESNPRTMDVLRASYPRDWDAALQVAIKESHVTPAITRKPASPRDWHVALHEAVSASYPQIRFSRGQAPPAQWEAMLKEALSRSQYPQPEAGSDIAVQGPVYFTSPAPKPLLWAGLAAQTSTMSRKGLWTPSTSSSSASRSRTSSPPAAVTELPRPRRKSSENSESVEVRADFSNQNMWKRTSSEELHPQDRDWLDDSMKKRFSRIELRY